MSGARSFFLRLCLLGLAAFTLVGGAMSVAADRTASPALPKAPVQKRTLVVPKVVGQVYVFAKGILEDTGFGWQVVGPVQGYAANLVQTQKPAPGTVVDDTGAPLVTLTLTENPSFRACARCVPENTAPYAGTAIHLAPSTG